jgi:hypothetical protein
VILAGGSVRVMTLSLLDGLVGGRRYPGDLWTCVREADDAFAQGDARALIEWPTGRRVPLPAED